MKKLMCNLLILLVSCSANMWAQDTLVNVYWDLIGDSTSTAQQDAFIATYTTGVPFYQDGVSAMMNHPKSGYGSQLKTGIYFHEATSSKGDNYVRLTVPAGQKGVFKAAWRPRNETSEYTFYAITQDSTESAPIDLYKYADNNHEIAHFGSQKGYPEMMIEKRFDFSATTQPQAIYLWFPATGLRYRGFGWEQLPDSTIIDDPTPGGDDTTHIPAADSLPVPLPAYNADFAKTIRILGIGNSFTVDLFDQHFVPLCQGEGLNVVIGYPYNGGTTVPEHVEYYNKSSKVYDYRKWVNGVLTKSGENTQTLNHALIDEPWDIVLIQTYGSSDSYATAAAGLNDLIPIIRSNVTSPKLGIHVTWSDATCGNLYGRTQEQQTDSIMFWGARNFNAFGFDYLSPVGRAIQNARTSFLGDNLNRDCHHLNMSEGRYIAALVFYEILTGKSCIGVNYYPASMTVYRAEVCQHAAHAAVLSPLKTTDLSKDYPVEKGVDPLKSVTVDGIQYSGEIDTVYADVTNTQTTIHIACGKDSSVVVPTPQKGRTRTCTLTVQGDDGTMYNHTFVMCGAAFQRHLWDAISPTDQVSATQDSICTQQILSRGDCSLQAFDNDGNAGTGAQTGFYLHANSESRPKTYIKLTIPGNCRGMLNVTARLGTALKNAVPPYPFYAYIQDADKDDPTTLYSTITIGDAENLAYYASLDNYDPLVMDGLYCNFVGKPSQHIYIYNTGNAQRYRQVEFIILDVTNSEPQGKRMSLSTDLKNLAASSDYKAMVCAHRGNSYEGKMANMPQSSIAELKKCIELGLDMVEVDGRVTRDGVVMNMHDATIDAFSTGTGTLAAMTYTEVRQYFLTNRDGTPSNEPIHTFREMLEAAKDSVYIVVDIKEAACCAKMAKIADSLDMIDQIAWYFPKSEKAGAVAIKSKYPNAILMPYSSTKSYLETLHSTYSPLYIFHTALEKLEEDATFTPKVQAYGMVSYANMLNSPDEAMILGDTTYMARMRAQNIRFIQSDYGDKVLEWLNGNHQHYVATEKEPTSVNNESTTSESVNIATKVLYKGQLFIHRGNKYYTIQGQEIIVSE